MLTFKKALHSGFGYDRQFVVLRGASAQVGPNRVLHVRARLRIQHDAEVLAQNLRSGITGQRLGRAVHGDEFAGEVVEEDDVVRVFKQLAVSLFATARRVRGIRCGVPLQEGEADFRASLRMRGSVLMRTGISTCCAIAKRDRRQNAFLVRKPAQALFSLIGPGRCNEIGQRRSDEILTRAREQLQHSFVRVQNLQAFRGVNDCRHGASEKEALIGGEPAFKPRRGSFRNGYGGAQRLRCVLRRL